MAKDDAYGTILKIGTAQVETAVVVVTTVVAGNATFTLTASGMANSPIATVVAVANNDTADTVATKAVAQMILDSDITNFFTVVAEGPDIVCTAVLAAANDGTMNLAYVDTTSSGITDDATSNDTTAGAVLATVAQVTGVGGPDLSLDTVDVTTHDSTNAWEETVGGFYAVAMQHSALFMTRQKIPMMGLLEMGLTRIKNRVRTDFSLIFPDTGSTTWGFNGEIVGFNPSAEHDGAITAAITIKITGEPTLV